MKQDALHRSRLPLLIWSLVNVCLLVGVPVWAYYDLLREARGLSPNEDTIAIPLMGIIVGCTAVAFVFNVV